MTEDRKQRTEGKDRGQKKVDPIEFNESAGACGTP
jgi:hypothetical protein